MSDDDGVIVKAVLAENALLDDGSDTTEFTGQRLIEFGLAGAIVAAAWFAMSAMMNVTNASQPTFEPVQPRVQLPFAPVIALRSALRETEADQDLATASIPASPPAAPVNRTLRPKPKAAAAIATDRARSVHPRKIGKAEDNPLKLIGRAATMFASDFARDFKRLPGQISTLFSGQNSDDATRSRKAR